MPFSEETVGGINLADAAGAVIARYSYDDWGGFTAVTDANGVEITDKTHIAHRNPLRYRSYYYDSETGFYHLQTRYYVPEFCRFLNADGIYDTATGILSHNMFAYCNNDPTNKTDSTGKTALEFTIFLAVLSVVGYVIQSILPQPEQTKQDFFCDQIEGVCNDKLPITKIYSSGKKIKDGTTAIAQNKATHIKNVVNTVYNEKHAKKIDMEPFTHEIFSSEEQYAQLCRIDGAFLVTAAKASGECPFGTKNWDALSTEEQKLATEIMGMHGSKAFLTIEKDVVHYAVDAASSAW